MKVLANAVLAAALLLAACSRDSPDPPAPAVTVTLTTERASGGACPRPPGIPSNCPAVLLATAEFRETAGGPAVLKDLLLEACRASGCSAAGQVDPRPAAQGHVLPARESLTVRFAYTYLASGRPDHAVITAKVVWLHGEYWVRAED